jgi:hypothetical protein
MTAFPTYEVGTVTVAANATAIVGVGTTWTGNNAFPGDTIEVAGFGPVKIIDVVDATHLTIKAWPFAAVTSGAAYAIFKDSALRFTALQTAVNVDALMDNLRAKGLLWYLDPAWSDPNVAKPPYVADDGQGILEISTGKLWVMTGGTWVFVGINKGFGSAAPWNSATAYNLQDVATLNGTS